MKRILDFLAGHTDNADKVQRHVLANMPPSDPCFQALRDLMADLLDRIPDTRVENWRGGRATPKAPYNVIYSPPAKLPVLSMSWTCPEPAKKPLVTIHILDQESLVDLDPSDPNDRAGMISTIVNLVAS